jgi:predicted helicase
MRKHLARDFDQIDHLDLHGNVRRNAKLSGTTHNVFGIQVGVGITLAIKKQGLKPTLRYFRVPETWRKREKLDFLAERHIAWRSITPDVRNSWIVPENADEYNAFLALSDIFSLYSVGVKTNRDDVVYDWNPKRLADRMREFTADYNAEVHRHKANPTTKFAEHIKWSETLKAAAVRGSALTFDGAKIVSSLYRPFTKKWLYFDRLVNERVYRWPNISGRVIVTSDLAWRAPTFSTLMTNCIADLHLCAAIDAHQCFPVSHVGDTAVTQFRDHYCDDSITKEDVFHYVYALLHHPGYRERYAENLKRELPRIPLAPGFQPFATAGQELARLHVHYESLEPWPLEYIERKDVPFSESVTKMKLSKDRTSIRINDSLILAGIPAEAFDYKLGSKSAIEWIVDQYHVNGESDPNREDDPGYIVRLVGQVVQVSIETVRIAKSFPGFRLGEG